MDSLEAIKNSLEIALAQLIMLSIRGWQIQCKKPAGVEVHQKVHYLVRQEVQRGVSNTTCRLTRISTVTVWFPSQVLQSQAIALAAHVRGRANHPGERQLCRKLGPSPDTAAQSVSHAPSSLLGLLSLKPSGCKEHLWFFFSIAANAPL